MRKRLYLFLSGVSLIPVLLLVLLMPTNILLAQKGKEPIKVTDLLKIKSIGGVTLSKDGSKVPHHGSRHLSGG